MLFVDEFCGILVYIKFGADVTSQYEAVVDIFGKGRTIFRFFARHMWMSFIVVLLLDRYEFQVVCSEGPGNGAIISTYRIRRIKSGV